MTPPSTSAARADIVVITAAIDCAWARRVFDRGRPVVGHRPRHGAVDPEVGRCPQRVGQLLRVGRRTGHGRFEPGRGRRRTRLRHHVSPYQQLALVEPVADLVLGQGEITAAAGR